MLWTIANGQWGFGMMRGGIGARGEIVLRHWDFSRLKLVTLDRVRSSHRRNIQHYFQHSH